MAASPYAPSTFARPVDPALQARQDAARAVEAVKRRAADDLLSRGVDMGNDEVVASLRQLGVQESYRKLDTGELRSLDPRPHQIEALKFLLKSRRAPGHETSGGALLAMEMGLGKTWISGFDMAVNRHCSNNVGPCLVVCPLNIVDQWGQELASIFGTNLRVMLAPAYQFYDRPSTPGSPVFDVREEASSELIRRRCDVLVTTYNALLACWAHEVEEITYLDHVKSLRDATDKQEEGRLTDMLDILEETRYKRGELLEGPRSRLAAALAWTDVRPGQRIDKREAMWTPEASKFLHSMLGTEWDTVVFDESHKLRNMPNKTYKACKFLKRRFLIMCTGTPKFNTDADYWAQFALCGCSHVADHTFWDRVYKKSASEMDQAARKELERIHMFSKTREQVGVLNVDMLSPRAMPGTHARRLKSWKEQEDEEAEAMSQDTSTQAGEEMADWRQSEMVIRSTSIVPDVLKEMGWRLYSAGIGGTISADGRSYVYDGKSGGLPPGFCQTLELIPTPELDRAMNWAAKSLREELVQGVHDPGKSVNVLTTMSLLWEMSEGWKYPAPSLAKFLKTVPGLNWSPDLPHPKPAAIVRYVRDFVLPDEKFRIYCYHVGGARAIHDALSEAGIRATFITGETTRKEDRADLVARAKSDVRIRGLVMTRIGVLGQNMHQFNHCLFGSNWWHAQNDRQAVDRSIRDGQTKATYATWFIMGKSGAWHAIDKMMIERCLQKDRPDVDVPTGKRMEALARIFAEHPEMSALPLRITSPSPATPRRRRGRSESFGSAEESQQSVIDLTLSQPSPMDVDQPSEQEVQRGETGSPPSRKRGISSLADAVERDLEVAEVLKRRKLSPGLLPFESPHGLDYDWQTPLRCESCGKLCGPTMCPMCRLYVYCTRECQTAHWKTGHKPECSVLAGAIQEAADLLTKERAEGKVAWLLQFPVGVFIDYPEMASLRANFRVPFLGIDYAVLTPEERAAAAEMPATASARGLILLRFPGKAKGGYETALNFLNSDQQINMCRALLRTTKLMAERVTKKKSASVSSS